MQEPLGCLAASQGATDQDMVEQLSHNGELTPGFSTTVLVPEAAGDALRVHGDRGR